MAAHPIRESYFAGDANPALRLLPTWTKWCIERTGLGSDTAVWSREAPPRSTASSFVHREYEESVVGDNKAPFRQE